MKFILFLLLVIPLQSLAGRTWTLTVQVIHDSTELPVPDVQVELEDEKGTVGITDSEGIARFEGMKTESIHFYVKKEGFYKVESFEYSRKRKHDRKMIIRFIQTTGPNVSMEFRNRIKESREKYTAIREKEMEQLKIKLASIDTNEMRPCADSDSLIEIQYTAHFPGGVAELNKFIMYNLTYPEKAIDYNEQGTVYISFIIDKDGSVTDVKVMRGVSKLLDAEAKRVINGMPKWIPSYCNGRPLKTRLKLPLLFTLN